MGAGESKPSIGSQHVFQADTPVRFSQQLTSDLQGSAESDSTRAKNIELKIQARVSEELEKILSQSSSKLASITDKVSSEPFKPSREPPKPRVEISDEQTWTERPLFNRIGDFLTGGIFGSSKPKGPVFQPNLERSDVQKEIDELKSKLAGRKQIKEVDEGVQKAQDEVAKCLKLNDRRPLDCWQEVENFKAEVGRLEKQFMDQNRF